MDRAQFREVAKRRLADAETLFQANRYAGAYYLSGYAVECGLKACIAKQTRRSSFPRRLKGNDDPYTHDLTRLLNLAGLVNQHQLESAANPKFGTYWTTTKDWKEDARYDLRSKSEAKDILEAISEPNYGVLRWIAKHW